MPQSAALDIVQRAREAIVAILDTNADIVTITGRADGNIVPWRNDLDSDAPILAFFMIVATPNGQPGDTREMPFQITAVGRDEAEANEMLRVVEDALTAPALAALPIPLDAMPVNRVRRPAPFESENYRADLEISLVVTK